MRTTRKMALMAISTAAATALFFGAAGAATAAEPTPKPIVTTTIQPFHGGTQNTFQVLGKNPDGSVAQTLTANLLDLRSSPINVLQRKSSSTGSITINTDGLPDGEYGVQITAKQGSASSGVTIKRFKVDNTAPVINYGQSGAVNEAGELTWTAFELTDNIGVTRVVVNSTEIPDAYGLGSTQVYASGIGGAAITPAGESIPGYRGAIVGINTITAYDAVGNVTVKQFELFNDYYEPPTGN